METEVGCGMLSYSKVVGNDDVVVPSSEMVGKSVGRRDEVFRNLRGRAALSAQLLVLMIILVPTWTSIPAGKAEAAAIKRVAQSSARHEDIVASSHMRASNP